MKFTIITLFPDFFGSLENYSVIGRAIKSGKIEINLINLRDFGLGSYKQVDDKPYGGGVGMLLRVDVAYRAISFAQNNAEGKNKTVLLCPSGEKYDQKIATDFKGLDELIIICGHYEGFDRRIYDYVDEVISIGNFVLSGGEIAAMTLIDSIARLQDGVLGNARSLDEESFIDEIEYPQYTRPEEFQGKKVPEILLSGDPKKISQWKKDNADH